MFVDCSFSITLQFDINAHITNIKCDINVDNEYVQAKISFDNLDYGKITAIKFEAKGFNSFGDLVCVSEKESFFLLIQDLCIAENESANNLKVKLPNNDIRKLELQECQICYEDGSVVSYLGKDECVFETNELDENDSNEKYKLEAIRNVISDKFQIFPKENDKGWLCCCGRINKKEDVKCRGCKLEKILIFKIDDDEYLNSVCDTYKQNIQKIEVDECHKKQKNKKIFKALGGVCVFIVCVIFIVFISTRVCI